MRSAGDVRMDACQAGADYNAWKCADQRMRETNTPYGVRVTYRDNIVDGKFYDASVEKLATCKPDVVYDSFSTDTNRDNASQCVRALDLLNAGRECETRMVSYGVISDDYQVVCREKR